MRVPKQDRTQARERLARDQELADRLPELLKSVSETEDALDSARQHNAPVGELRDRGLALDTALTDAMRAAYAHERVLVGPKGYVDRIQRRKRMARPGVKRATRIAERLLTEREAHRLHGIQRVPRRVV
ncbi:hypothetical protein [Nocardiopsis listeri]|uniref:hypothetical protein n=1 Tax=Nocardiopsis listeri TaxID=53440 RepID=UPI000835372A|nr:hypothetical protein [Nocardiopsis listeri]